MYVIGHNEVVEGKAPSCLVEISDSLDLSGDSEIEKEEKQATDGSSSRNDAAIRNGRT
jgi:hypothetical protein